jgi:hypothetical protein
MKVLLKDLKPGQTFTFSGSKYVVIEGGGHVSQVGVIHALRFAGDGKMGRAWTLASFGLPDDLFYVTLLEDV